MICLFALQLFGFNIFFFFGFTHQWYTILEMPFFLVRCCCFNSPTYLRSYWEYIFWCVRTVRFSLIFQLNAGGCFYVTKFTHPFHSSILPIPLNVVLCITSVRSNYFRGFSGFPAIDLKNFFFSTFMHRLHWLQMTTRNDLILSI